MSLRENLRFKDWSYRPTSTPAQRRNALGLNLTFAFVGVTFASALLAYVLVWLTLGSPRGSSVPPVLWVSTACGLSGGWCLRRAVRAVGRERQVRFRGLMLLATTFGVAFAEFQSFGLWQIARLHVGVRDQPSTLNGFLAALILLHALHFLSGLVVLVVTTGRAFAGRYDHEYHFGVVLAARYWMFLDAVWLVMLVCFAVTG